MRAHIVISASIATTWLAPSPALAWGKRAHEAINRAAVRTLPSNGPAFLEGHEEWIVYLATIPDTWRRPSEPFAKMLEDPNHGWFKEQFTFLRTVPRSRYEFVLALYDEHRRLRDTNPEAARLTNVRWTGTLPYAAVETYERMVAAMRRYREAKASGTETRFIELEIASYMGRLGHYTGDGAQPLHDTIHHDGWQGANPRGYTTERSIHGRFESRFVDRMELTIGDFEGQIGRARVLEDPFDAILAHLDAAAEHVEDVYRLDKAGALEQADHGQARRLVIQQVARGAALLRDLTHTAWVRSADTPEADPADDPVDPANPRYNPATGSAPAPPPGGRR